MEAARFFLLVEILLGVSQGQKPVAVAGTAATALVILKAQYLDQALGGCGAGLADALELRERQALAGAEVHLLASVPGASFTRRSCLWTSSPSLFTLLSLDRQDCELGGV